MIQAKKLKRLEVENAHLKRLVADLAPDNRVLKGAAEGNFQVLNGSGAVSRLRACVMGCRNAGRVERIWREEGLQVPQRVQKRASRAHATRLKNIPALT